MAKNEDDDDRARIKLEKRKGVVDIPTSDNGDEGRPTLPKKKPSK